MKILNLYAGIGGNRKLWGDEYSQYEITAIELEPSICKVYQELYPADTVLCYDAHQYLLENYKEFDFIWSSPPCPTHSRMRNSLVKSPAVYPDMKLYEEIIFLQTFYKGDWVVENVIPFYQPLIRPVAGLDRHLFWSNRHIGKAKGGRTFGRITDQTKETLATSHAIVLPQGTQNQRKLLRNAVDPELGLHVFNAVNRATSQQQVNDLVELDLFGEVSVTNPPK